MTLQVSLATGSIIALLAIAPAQDTGNSNRGSLTRVQDAFDRDTWSAALLAPDLERRKSSYMRLLEEARESTAARRALEDWAASDEGELAWTSWLALRELQQQPVRDPLSAFREPRQRSGFGSPFGGGDPFDAFGAWDHLLRGLDRGFGAFDPFAPMPGLPDDADVQGESFRLESGPDGVRVHVLERGEDGDVEKTYEAESLEELLEHHPELKGRIRLDGAIPGQRRERFSDLMDRLRGGSGGRFDFDSLLGAPVPTDRLGVLMREPGQYSSSVKGVEPGVGLLVERVLPGTIAHQMDLRRGDILLELDGIELRSGADVKRALEARSSGATVKLVVVDADGRRVTRSWTPPRGA